MIELQAKTLKKMFMEYSEHCLYDKKTNTKGFMVSEQDKKPLGELFDCLKSAAEGMVIYGGNGTGKTIVFELLRRIIHRKDPIHFIMKPTMEVTKAFNIHGDQIFDPSSEHNVLYKDLNVVYDDLGSERFGVHYSSKDVNLIQELVQRRYSLFMEKKRLTSFTTNMTPDELKEMYGERVWSRLKGMCRHIQLNDGDKRAKKNFIAFPPVKLEDVKTEDDIWWDKAYEACKKVSQEYTPPPSLSLGQKLKESLGVENFHELKKKKKK